MSARVNVTTARTVQLDGKAEQTAVYTEQDVQDPAKLASLLTDLAAIVKDLKKVRQPKFIDFEDIKTTAGGNVILPHGLGGRVRWWVIDWVPGTTGNVIGAEGVAASTTSDTLVIKTYAVGVASFRVELA